MNSTGGHTSILLSTWSMKLWSTLGLKAALRPARTDCLAAGQPRPQSWGHRRLAVDSRVFACFLRNNLVGTLLTSKEAQGIPLRLGN